MTGRKPDEVLEAHEIEYNLWEGYLFLNDKEVYQESNLSHVELRDITVEHMETILDGRNDVTTLTFDSMVRVEVYVREHGKTYGIVIKPSRRGQRVPRR